MAVNASAHFFSPLISHLFILVKKKKKFENRVKGFSSRVGSNHGQINLISHYGRLCVIQFSGPFHLTNRQRTCCQGPCFHLSSLCHPLLIYLSIHTICKILSFLAFI